jgi:NhaA family Na+:H+ antiporter
MPEKGINLAPWEKSFDRILLPLEEFIHRQTTSGVLLMLCAVVGINIAFCIPIRPKFDPDRFLRQVHMLADRMEMSVHRQPDIIHNNQFRGLVTSLGDGVQLVQAPAQRFEHLLHLPVACLVIPVFALANAGIPIAFSDFGVYLSHPISLGIIAGLVAGKLVGIAGFTWVALKLKWADIPAGLNMKHIVGVALLGGIGFTMSIFIAELGFANSPEDPLMAKTGILLASLIAGIGGFLWLALQPKPEE